MDNYELAFGLDWDRQYFVAFAKTFRQYFWPLSIFIVHPFTIFVIVRKSPMSIDCKCAYIVHHLVLMCFDFYNGALYQMYPMAPIPVFICTGWLCDGMEDGKTLLTGLSFWTIIMCIPYLFIMMRMHQMMLFQDSIFKVNKKIQFLLLLALSTSLVANVFGFHFWTNEPANKFEIIEKPEIAWANKFTTNFLVLGENEGEIGAFRYELILLVVSIFVNFSFYVFITYHAVFKIGTEQACCSAILFILPMLILFIALFVVRVRWLFPGWFIAPLRFCMLMAFTCCSIAHSLVYLSKNPWFNGTVRKTLGVQQNPVASISNKLNSEVYCYNQFIHSRKSTLVTQTVI